MTWDTEQFQQILKDKLGDTPITSIELRGVNCSSITLNELLSVIYFNMDEDGLEEIMFESFP